MKIYGNGSQRPGLCELRSHWRGSSAAAARTSGSGWRTTLGIRCLDREIVSHAARQLALDEAELAQREERGASFWERMLRGISASPPEAMYHAPVTLSFSDREIFEAETDVMKAIAAQEDCVIVGRLAAYILPPHPGMVNIFLHAPLGFRVPRVM